MQKRILIIITILLIGGIVWAADNPMEGKVKGYFDNAFFGVLNYLYSNLAIYAGIARKLAKMFLILDLGTLGIFLAFGQVEVEKELVKRLITLGTVVAVMGAWATTYLTITNITLEIANTPVKATIAGVERDYMERLGTMYRKYLEAKAVTPKSYDDGSWITGGYDVMGEPYKGISEAEIILKQYEELRKSFKDLGIWAKEGKTPLPGTTGSIDYQQYIRPEAILVYTQALMAPIWAQAQRSGLDIGRALMLGFTVLLVYIMASLITIQYIIAMVEWAVFGVAALLFIPTALFTGTKFISEKIFTTAIGHIIKIILTYLILGIITGLLYKLNTDDYTGKQDEIIKLIFNFILYFALITAIPNMANSLIGGSPSMSLGNVANVARGAMAGATTATMLARNQGGKVLSSAYHALHAGAGAAGAAIGAAESTKGTGVDKAMAAGASLSQSVSRALGSSKTALGQKMLSNSAFSSGKGGVGAGPGTGGGGVQDKGDEMYQQSLNPDSRYYESMRAPGVANYFNLRKASAQNTGSSNTGDSQKVQRAADKEEKE